MVSTGGMLTVPESSPGEAVPALLSQRPHNKAQSGRKIPPRGVQAPSLSLKTTVLNFSTVSYSFPISFPCFFYLSVAKITNPCGYLNSDELKLNEMKNLVPHISGAQ